MAGNAAAPVQIAVLARLWADATLITLTGAHPTESGKGRVYDEPPEGAAFPYLVIGDAVERPANRMGGKVGRTLDVFVEAWSEKRGYTQCRALLARVDALLDNYLSLSVTGYTTELVNFEGADYVRTARNGTPLREGIARYRIDLVET